MRDSKLSVMLVWPSGTDPLVSGLCRALRSSWLLTRLSTARYRYWYCSCRGQTRSCRLGVGCYEKDLHACVFLLTTSLNTPGLMRLVMRATW